MLKLNANDFNVIKEDDYCEKRQKYVASRKLTYGDDGLPIKEDRHVYTLYDDTYWIYGELTKYLTVEIPGQRYKRNLAPMPASVDLIFATPAKWHR